MFALLTTHFFPLLLAEQAKRVNRFKWWYLNRGLPNSDKTNQNQRHMTGMHFGFKPLSELLFFPVISSICTQSSCLFSISSCLFSISLNGDHPGPLS